MANALTLLVLAGMLLAPAVLLVAIASRCTSKLRPDTADRRQPVCHHYGGQRIR
jgi:hypothetical protein